MSISNEDLIKALSEKSVMEVVELVKSLEEEWGVSAAAPVAVAAAGGADAGAARHGCGASAPRAAGPADADRAGGRNRRSARSASFLRAGRLWRRGGEPLSGLRDARGNPRPPRTAAERRAGRTKLYQGCKSSFIEDFI